MMTRNAWLVGVLLGAIVLGGCSNPAKTNPEPPAPLQLTAADSGSTQQMQVGQQLVLSLEANPSTGYRWEDKGGAPQVLKELGQPSFARDSTAVGAGGIQEWKYQAVLAGSGTLAMVYVRPWETTATPAQTFNATIVVK